MNPNQRRVAVLASLVMAVALSGCIGSSEDPAGVDSNESLQEGHGAIRGILVDDRYRPIHLVDGDVQSEFQAPGFILVQELGQEVRTNANGEFEIRNLDPGHYTLRLQSEDHEARTNTVQVAAAEYAETTVEARRIVSDDGAVLVQQHAVFIPCAVWVVVTGMLPDCTFDQSADAMSPDFMTDLSAHPDLSYVVTEMRANRVDDYGIQIRADERFAVAVVTDQDYVRIVNQPGVANEVDVDAALGPNAPFDASEPFQTILFAMGDHHQTVANSGLPGVCCGYGVKLATKANFVQSAFIGVPDQEVDMDTYCVQC